MTTVGRIRPGADGVYIGRAGHGFDGYFGNPHPVGGPCPLCPGVTHWRGQAIEAFRPWFLARVGSDPEFRRRVLGLRGKRLLCFCAPKPCHGHVIAAWIDAQPEIT